MKIVETVKQIREEVARARQEGKKVGFVPTMGYLHEGHASLIQRAKAENEFVVVSIFVNPTQFGVGEDFETYPRDLERDSEIAEQAGANIIFHPTVGEMYPLGYRTYVDVEGITSKLCGASRPGHFRGVTTIVSKLFHMVKADRAYFGQKDAQQVAVIQQMVRDLNMDIEIVPCPIVREADGLAMSSRNTYLNPSERQAALILSKSLFEAQGRIDHGEHDAGKLGLWIKENIQTEPLAKIDYVEIVDAVTLEEIEEIKGDVLIALAVRIGKTRLIDNIRLEV
ncbi:MAG: pantoate--beta-alanine ligase [Anaerosolibacter sp.]|jgi:pantoate--beta-alanine ligase|uniref:pantoate--beta-alanine ligase n=1 Tax=Anaerosolibacter sp. TaxID=1872527 RepID=UPI00263660AD|nr:pantoate--beta-alanine ligase [Anaerosolibacter sp.]MDF2545277.1 pantoate--beta-alanine ligase [Anaerosolibacter sp.]